MRSNVTLFLLICALLTLFTGCSTPDDFPVLKRPYLGQKPPGMMPEIFAPGIISTGYDERIAAFTPDGKELYYALWGAPHGVILHTREVNGRWTKPEIAPFSGQYEGDFTMSSDGKRIVFSSNSPFVGTGKPQDDYYSWIVERTESVWGKPKPFGPLINSSESFTGYPTIADNGNLYFYSARSGGKGDDDIWMSRFVDGNHDEPENLGESINTDDLDLDPFIAPDESYIIFARLDKERKGNADLYISFMKDNGTWAQAKNMGEKINSDGWEFCPTVSPDKKYLFFTSDRRLYKPYSETPLSYKRKLEILDSPGNGSDDIYWVDAKIIEDLKPIKLK